MARFKHTDNSQGQFITVNLSEQLLLGSFEWTINHLINKMDLTLFENNYHNDERGAAAYPPRALLKAILFCYSRGIISSRQIEKACIENITVKALAEDTEPDHDTIATFITTNSEAVKELFSQILIKCSELKLITGEMFAIDGCKLPSNASKEWSGKIKDLKKKKIDLEKMLFRILHQHQELDRNTEAQKIQKPFSKTLGDDEERRNRHVKRIENKLKRIEQFLSTAEPKIGSSGQEVQTNITDKESARIKGPHGYIQGYNGIAIADSGSQVIVASEAIGSGAESGCLPEMLDSLEKNMKEVTGKEKPLKKSLVLGDTGYFSEDNLQEAAKRDIKVLIPDPQFRKRDPGFDDRKKYKTTNVKKYFGIEDFQYNKTDDSFTCPAGQKLVYKCDIEFKSRGTRGKQYRQKKSVCSVCSQKEQCINRKSGKGEFRALFIAEQKHEENLSRKMRDKIDNPAYRELYSRRMQIIEPVFANMTYCKKMNRFTYRGQEKVNTQWLLFTIVHNLWKCIKPLGAKYGV
jgi:transposase